MTETIQEPPPLSPDPDTITVQQQPERRRPGRPRKYPLLTATADIIVYLQHDLST